VIPEIDIWRIANLMLKRYGDNAEVESAVRAHELTAPAITAGPRSGAGSRTPSRSSQTEHPPARCTGSVEKAQLWAALSGAHQISSSRISGE
jgi:hypothetical protein